MGIKRLYVEKKKDYAVAAKDMLANIRDFLGIKNVKNVRILCRYDMENLSEDVYHSAKGTIFSEPPLDIFYEECLPIIEDAKIFSVEALPGQFDQRADSAVQCVKLLSEDEEPVIKTAVTYVIEGELNEDELKKIKIFCINPVDSRECDEIKPDSLKTVFEEPSDVLIFDGFITMDETHLQQLYQSLSLAMTFKDFLHIHNYFVNEEKRDPSITEIRVLDTYWSDHCRHTTFLTELKNIEFEEGYYREPIESTFKMYKEHRKEIFGEQKGKYISLMDIALMGMRKLKRDGKLNDLEESEEINACSIVVPVDVDGNEEEWLISFKNETHNHPTEIEPFGGAATCLGGAIRDPLSGRSYVYQAMRITGASDPTVMLEDTLEGKLPQRKIVTGAAKGYSSYGNQIGLATGFVNEIYHPGYVAKRLEIGAVIGAAPRKNVVRKSGEPGDVIILLGGRTGRDGCGGATGSSKAHTNTSIDTCGAEVQKGNAPTERKIQRLFRKEVVSRLIKKCNDFGAGGVCVAIGELADGIRIDLNKVPKKYEGLDGTELAISESQERMAVIIDKKDVEQFLAFADAENLEAVCVAEVQASPRLIMEWRGNEIVNISRAFLDTNGAHQGMDVYAQMPDASLNYLEQNEEITDLNEKWLDTLSDLNVCSQKGLVEMFDSSIGAASVYMPYGGKYQSTPAQVMAAKVPVLNAKTQSVTMMSYGYDPFLSSWSPYHGAIYAVLDSMAKIVASGGDYSKIRFTFQEYFKRVKEDRRRMGEPLLALLGAYAAQIGFGLPSIGGKDSMSGTFNQLDVPPTLVSFAVGTGKYNHMITPELKTPGNQLVLFKISQDQYHLPLYNQIKELYDSIHQWVKVKKIKSAYAIGRGGIAAAISKMAFGNNLGVTISSQLKENDLFKETYGNILAEMTMQDIKELGIKMHIIGEVKERPEITYKDMVLPLGKAIDAWAKPLEKVYPTKSGVSSNGMRNDMFTAGEIYICKNKVTKPGVFIPVFPGTNCEYDTLKAFEKAGAKVETVVFKNLNADHIRESIDVFDRAIQKAQIIMFPGGFTAGDEPDGSGKFIAAAFRNEKIKEAVMKLLNERDGLVLGICNGFQALIKLGLLPYGEIKAQQEDSPTLAINSIGRHISKIVYTKVVSNKSPWLAKVKAGDVYAIPASHGEGRFVANEKWLNKLFAEGCIATQYVDIGGNPTMKEEFNPNGSYQAIEGITSPDGRVFGKMAHSERIGRGVAINITGNQNQYIFESGVEYFK